MGTAHSEVNPNTRVMNSRGIWLSYVLAIGLLHVVLLSIPFASVPVVWTLTNLIHNLVRPRGGPLPGGHVLLIPVNRAGSDFCPSTQIGSSSVRISMLGAPGSRPQGAAAWPVGTPFSMWSDCPLTRPSCSVLGAGVVLGGNPGSADHILVRSSHSCPLTPMLPFFSCQTAVPVYL